MESTIIICNVNVEIYYIFKLECGVCLNSNALSFRLLASLRRWLNFNVAGKSAKDNRFTMHDVSWFENWAVKCVYT